MDELNKEQIKSNLTVIVYLEYVGVHFDDIKEGDLFSQTKYYYSVPESSTLEVKDESLNKRIKTADDLKYLAKEMLIDMLIDSCKNEFGEDDEFVFDVKNNINNYFKFYAKVRKGEVWNKELAEQRLNELTNDIQTASGYKEI